MRRAARQEWGWGNNNKHCRAFGFPCTENISISAFFAYIHFGKVSINLIESFIRDWCYSMR